MGAPSSSYSHFDADNDFDQSDLDKNSAGCKRYIFLIAKIFTTVFIIWDTYSAWAVFYGLDKGTIPLPDYRVYYRLEAAWGFFATVGVLTALLMIWDMMVESLEDFGVAKRLENQRLAPQYELFLVSAVEEIPQSAILLYVLTRYNVAIQPTQGAAIFAFMQETAIGIILDSLGVLFRIIGAGNRLFAVIHGIYKHHRLADVVILVLDVLVVSALIAMMVTGIVFKNRLKIQNV